MKYITKATAKQSIQSFGYTSTICKDFVRLHYIFNCILVPELPDQSIITNKKIQTNWNKCLRAMLKLASLDIFKTQPPRLSVQWLTNKYFFRFLLIINVCKLYCSSFLRSILWFWSDFTISYKLRSYTVRIMYFVFSLILAAHNKLPSHVQGYRFNDYIQAIK